MEVEEHVALAPRTTMGLGGPARFFVHARYDTDVRAAWAWARERNVPLHVLGGGSNVVIDDAGVEGLVLHVDTRGIEWREGTDFVDVMVAAGEPWDDLVRCAVEREWAGLECLSGIPGRVGATPIQNVGAYGQEVSETIATVYALDRTTGETVGIPRAECAFGYRDSRFKSGEPGRFIVMGVAYRLTPGAPTVKYDELAKHLRARAITEPKLTEVRDSVLEIRRAKSMVIDDTDPNRRSCGSFFTNPVVEQSLADSVATRAGVSGMPRWAQPDGRVKLSAAWLIERAGFGKGQTAGPVGLSTRHTLAVVCHEGARATDVAAFARHIRDTVAARFGVRLAPEPVLWGGLSLES